MSRIGHALITLTTAFCLSSCKGHIPAEKNTDWPAYGGGLENTHYSPLTTINRDNVKDLQLAWSYDTHEVGGLEQVPSLSEVCCTELHLPKRFSLSMRQPANRFGNLALAFRAVSRIGDFPTGQMVARINGFLSGSPTIFTR